MSVCPIPVTIPLQLACLPKPSYPTTALALRIWPDGHCAEHTLKVSDDDGEPFIGHEIDRIMGHDCDQYDAIGKPKWDIYARSRYGAKRQNEIAKAVVYRVADIEVWGERSHWIGAVLITGASEANSYSLTPEEVQDIKAMCLKVASEPGPEYHYMGPDSVYDQDSADSDYPDSSDDM